MIGFYYYISKNSSDRREIVSLFRDVLVQFARQLQIFLQKGDSLERSTHWRPFIISISSSVNRSNAFDLIQVDSTQIWFWNLYTLHKRLLE